MEFDPKNLEPRQRYGLMIASIVPRPIAWVSTMDTHGALNLAPFSYFTGACTDPMTVLFCPVVPNRAGSRKDTLANVQATGEFVVNFTNMKTAAVMNRCATDLPPDASEFEWAPVTPEPSKTVKTPRVAEAPIAFECTLQQIVTVNDQPGGGYVVFGEVQHIVVRDEIMTDGRIDRAKYDPIGRLGGNDYVHVNNTFTMERLPAPEQV